MILDDGRGPFVKIKVGFCGPKVGQTRVFEIFGRTEYGRKNGLGPLFVGFGPSLKTQLGPETL